MDAETTRHLDALHKATLGLYLRWKLYRFLVDGAEPSIDTLASGDTSALYLMQQLLLDDCVLRLCRLTEKAQAGSFRYLTVRALVESLETQDPEFVTAKLAPVVEKLESACEPLRRRRNSQIAHADLLLGLQDPENHPAPPDIETVQAAMKLLQASLNCVSWKYRGARTTYWDVVVAQTADGERLLASLARALGIERH